ncbi:MFS transporter [Asticcacaulis machinosus]|uniref:MFS transporter n=1 Tax=Asticcacaulis machinosus TaxID=2984211 RepID=A0ABT5HN30_9CAUL|nr:MFS transporter [Asticcacaulis machinosus]MDC7677654.1 MFS transporter [Asticcacaulis machinosus]
MSRITIPFSRKHPHPPRADLSTRARQAMFYTFVYIGTGASLPYMPLWFQAQGLSGSEIGLILAVPLLLRAASGPVIGVWADNFKLYRTPMIWLALAGAIFYALMAASPAFADYRFYGFLVLWTVGYTLTTSVSPLIDAMTFQLAAKEGFAYTFPRAIGSAVFVATNILLGFLLTLMAPDIILVWVVLAGLGISAAAALILQPKSKDDLPDAEAIDTDPRESGAARLKTLLANPTLVWVVVAMGCFQASHSFYYGFSTIIWKGEGYSGTICGYLWAVGVVAEVAYMGLTLNWRRRVGPWRMLILAGVLSVARWGIMALSPPLSVLWFIQALHAFSFAAIYLAGLELVQTLSPRRLGSLAQSLNAAFTTGVMMGLGTLASGAVYDRIGSGGYALMAGLSAAGLLIAVVLYRIQRSAPQLR